MVMSVLACTGLFFVKYKIAAESLSLPNLCVCVCV